jgi:uncharacterized protein GlcG (DUF336 family)
LAQAEQVTRAAQVKCRKLEQMVGIAISEEVERI